MGGGDLHAPETPGSAEREVAPGAEGLTLFTEPPQIWTQSGVEHELGHKCG